MEGGGVRARAPGERGEGLAAGGGVPGETSDEHRAGGVRAEERVADRPVRVAPGEGRGVGGGEEHAGRGGPGSDGGRRGGVREGERARGGEEERRHRERRRRARRRRPGARRGPGSGPRGGRRDRAGHRRRRPRGGIESNEDGRVDPRRFERARPRARAPRVRAAGRRRDESGAEEQRAGSRVERVAACRRGGRE